MDTRDIYARVLVIVEFFLKNAAHLTITELQNYNPSIEELARDVKRLASILGVLANDYEDENMAINALQCCLQLRNLANVVRHGEESELDSIFKTLELHTQVP
jgi:hypothetical protein